MYDLIIKNGSIIDGTGSPSYQADIAIQDGKIVRISKGIESGKNVIDARGLTVTPGFIDSHSHSDRSILTFPDQIEKIEQGITTSIAGQCGSSPAPRKRDTQIYTMSNFLNDARNVPQGSNIAVFAGHSTIRSAVMGMENRVPTEEELDQMKSLLREAMEHGALGVSFGLIYPPSCYAQTPELIALAKVVAQYHGLVAAHVRQEGDFLIKSTAEFIKILKEAGVRGIHSHFKSMGKENWGKVQHALRMLDQANEEGTEIYCDVYPYSASCTSLGVRFVPKEYHSLGLNKVLTDSSTRQQIKEWNLNYWGEDLSWVMVTQCSAYPQYERMMVPDIAKLHGKDGYETIFDMVMSGTCQGCFFMMCEEDIENVLAYPRAMICTDAGVAGTNTSYHPRLRGSFPRVLGRYVRERNVTTLPEMIRKMTAMPATVYGLHSKGLLKEGFDADLCIFDANKIMDHAGFTDCHKRAEGLNYVILSGQVVVTDAVYNGIKAGKLILRV